MVVFTTVQALTNQTKQLCIKYNWVRNLLGIPRNNPKHIKGILVIVFRIAINIKKFIARHLNDELEKVVKAMSKILAKQLVIFFDILLLVGFLSFSS